MKRWATLASAAALVASASGAAPPLAPPIPPVHALADCAARSVTLHVAAGASQGDGSAARPFATLGAAFASVAKQGVCALTIRLAPGDYAESITTAIPNVTIRASAATRPAIHGTLTHTGRGLFDLSLLDVTRATGVAVREIGGRVRLDGVRVTDTALVASDADTGVGLWVSDGAEAVVRMSAFERNAHNAIRAEGAGTRLWVIASTIEGSGVHPLVRARMTATPPPASVDAGALLVTRGASAWVSASTIDGAAGAGVDVASSARARLERVVVKKVTGDGAQGIAAHDGATIEAIDSTASDSALCGVAAISAALTMTSGTIARAPVGACARDPRMSLSCLQRGTKYMDVTTPLQTERYAPPSLEPATPACPTVEVKPLPSW